LNDHNGCVLLLLKHDKQTKICSTLSTWKWLLRTTACCDLIKLYSISTASTVTQWVRSTSANSKG